MPSAMLPNNITILKNTGRAASIKHNTFYTHLYILSFTPDAARF